MSSNAWLAAFHFLRPLWLLALPFLWTLVVWLARRRTRQQDWSGIIDAELLPALQLDAAVGTGARSARPWPWLALAWTLAVLALAGPSWQQDRAPAYRAAAAWVVVLDLSPSMQATDLSPNRVTRARYAIDDILGAARDARVGLVVFSDEPYTVTPLTQDVATVRALMPALAPAMMPSAGDHLAPALQRAQKLLDASGASDKRIVVVTDGFDDPAAAINAGAAPRVHGVTLSVVGVGTPAGAPPLNADPLKQLATVGAGGYVDIAHVPELVSDLQGSTQQSGQASAAQGLRVAHWRDGGVYLLPMLLLLVALLTRRRWL
ncbi:von Willebrand factor type A domain protein [mine drainage metagenome]|uniref:von Willebrand factor type A domain protein n=1 Tax=mine drainage metagenome TaxID=410659 RepID=A0A1J5PYD5_9ZZZZ